MKLGIIGYGVVGKHRRECVEQHPNMTLVAVCDRSFSSEAESHDDINYYQSYQTLIDIPSQCDTRNSHVPSMFTVDKSCHDHCVISV